MTLHVSPTWPEFQKLAKQYNLIAVRAETVVDRLTPVGVYEQLAAGQAYAFLLESVEGGERFGRYSFVGRRPMTIFECRDQHVVWKEGGRNRRASSINPLHELKTYFAGLRPAPSEILSRFWGGAVGYCSYDMVRCFEKLPKPPAKSLGLPTAIFQMTGELVILDHFSQKAQVLSIVRIPESGLSTTTLKKLYAKAQRSILRQLADLNRRLPNRRSAARTPLLQWSEASSEKSYLTSVEKGKDYIRAGDIIQVVLSRRWGVKTRLKPFDVYRALRCVNPSPYMYLIHTPELDLVGSSPELLVRKENNQAETRPIAGTRRRGSTPEEDARLSEELRNDPKERAEHLMLVDLGRNDLGRVCRSGSVRVPELMTVEHYSHVMHLVSSVTGQLAEDANAFDLFQACFPAGTVAGAPKIRAMQIIDELESLERGPYAGAVGYFSYNGNMDMAITIRTLVFQGATAWLQAGAGIVADSKPEHEARECEQKAAALRQALELAGVLSS